MYISHHVREADKFVNLTENNFLVLDYWEQIWNYQYIFLYDARFWFLHLEKFSYIGVNGSLKFCLNIENLQEIIFMNAYFKK